MQDTGAHVVRVESEHPSCRTRRYAISARSPALPIAEDVREEGQQSSERGDVSDSPGDDVLDPSEHATRRKRVRVEVQHERPIGW